MKIFFAAILTLLYASAAIGASVSIHNCTGNFVGKVSGYQSTKTCDKFRIENIDHNGLHSCKDENIFFKSQINQHVSIAIYHLKHPVAMALLIANFQLPPLDIYTIVKQHSLSYSPPESNSVTIFIRNCVFLL